MLVHYSSVDLRGHEEWIQSNTIPLPREGEDFVWSDGTEETVRTVVHYPWGCREYDDNEQGASPHVYVVVGRPRR